MKSFSAVGSLILVSVAAASPQLVVKGPSLEDVFGPVPVVDEMAPWAHRGRQSRIAANKSPSYYATRTTDNCVFPVELYLVADETGSFQDDYENMLDTQIKAMYDGLTASHPDSTFGVGSFKDIPVPTLGNEGDYCWKFRQALTQQLPLIRDAYADMISSGGGDVPEGQFKSIIAACQGSETGWTNPDATRLVVVVTDAPPHFSNDTFNKPEYNLAPYSGNFEETAQKEQCRTQYHPSPEQVKSALFAREVYTGFLIYGGNYNQGGKPIDAWKWFNSYIEQFDGFVGHLAEDSSNFWERLANIISEIEQVECVAPTTSSTLAATSPTTDTTEAKTTAIADTTEAETTAIADTTEAETTAPECGECIGSCEPGCNAVQIQIRDKPQHVRVEVDDEVWERGEKNAPAKKAL